MKAKSFDTQTATFITKVTRCGQPPMEVEVLGRILKQNDERMKVRYLDPNTLKHKDIILEK